MTIQEYLKQINLRFQTGISREHSYRGDLQGLLQTLNPGIMVTNEPARIECGAPDFILTDKSVPVGYVEAKDVGADLSSRSYQEQFNRYLESLSNLIITDYLQFRLYQDGELVQTVDLGSVRNGKVVTNTYSFSDFEALMHRFRIHKGQSIKTPRKLAELMAKNAKMLANVISNALEMDETISEYASDNNTLREQMEAFKQILIHDIKPREFADIYAQTIAYGMFAARLHDPDLDTFTRQEAATLIPKTNPFLRRLFQYVAGFDLDERIAWVVDALADVFRATDVASLLNDFGKATKQEDPIIHFYETFLSEYDPKLRKSRGVWYTPEPVVKFIVRAVDDMLKTEFGITQGLADTSKTKIKVKVPTANKKGFVETEQEVHKVQILDPATGTGTFLAEVIKQIHEKFKGQQGIWSNYVENHLIPRLNGFELLMASYAMAHLKLELLLTETGYKPTRDQRLRVYLTNTLEESHPDVGTLFASWLSQEANEANYIKRDTPVMVVIGNPPYSGESANKGKWIMDLMEDYKMEPGGIERLKERNPKWINDDYVKFLRYGQYLIEKNGEGILAFINPHGFLDNPTFRGMRWNLLKTFDKIYTIDLHGNSKKKETSPDGSKDENVFDIQQGVSINLMVKTSDKNRGKLCDLYSFDLYGSREFKYNTLLNHRVSDIDFVKLNYQKPQYFFIAKDFSSQTSYSKGFKIDDLFITNTVGIVTSRDNFVVSIDKNELIERIKFFFDGTIESVKQGLSIRENKSWKIETVKQNAVKFDSKFVREIDYRLFDKNYIYYNSYFIERSRLQTMKNMVNGANYGLVLCKQFKTGDSYQHVFISKRIIESCLLSNRTSEIGSLFPLFLESEIDLMSSNDVSRHPNFDSTIISQIESSVGLKLDSHRSIDKNVFAPIDILDYIYAVLHSPAYREKYKEFLKIDFPRVPYPTDQDTFWKLVELGGQIRKLHLMESEKLQNLITTYPQPGDNLVTRAMTQRNPGFVASTDDPAIGKVWINDEQYFDGVPLKAWEFYIGGYQPAQKWLKDRNGRQLTFDDILHYQRIIVALSETDRIMSEIDEVYIK